LKRGYSKAFTPRSNKYGRYLLDLIPATLWRDVKAKAKREGTSVRALILGLLTEWVYGIPLGESETTDGTSKTDQN
jgi:hypothetical protein